jgi:hypothetical protein
MSVVPERIMPTMKIGVSSGLSAGTASRIDAPPKC